jgi:non-ribosomal peptide synthetase component F
VLDPATLEPVERGKEGVLFVSGPGLAIGYLSNPTLTHERFVANPWAKSKDSARMYDTGDLVHIDEDGIFHFHGRADLQVKVRTLTEYSLRSFH